MKLIEVFKALKIPRFFIVRVTGIKKSILYYHFSGQRGVTLYYKLIYVVFYVVIKKFLRDKKLNYFNQELISNADKKRIQQEYKEFIKQKLPDLWSEYQTFGRPSPHTSKLSPYKIKQYLLQLSKSL